VKGNPLEPDQQRKGVEKEIALFNVKRLGGPERTSFPPRTNAQPENGEPFLN